MLHRCVFILDIKSENIGTEYILWQNQLWRDISKFYCLLLTFAVTILVQCTTPSNLFVNLFIEDLPHYVCVKNCMLCISISLFFISNNLDYVFNYSCIPTQFITNYVYCVCRFTKTNYACMLNYCLIGTEWYCHTFSVYAVFNIVLRYLCYW